MSARGTDGTERRRKALMAGQRGYQVTEKRKRRGLTKAQLAQAIGFPSRSVEHVTK